MARGLGSPLVRGLRPFGAGTSAAVSAPPVASGTVTISGTLTATGAFTKWQRAATWDGGGAFSDIVGATDPTYTPVPADIGYDLRAVGPGGNSNTLRYDPTTVTAVTEVWKVRTLSAGALASWVGAKAGYTLTAAGGARPTVGATSFNGTVGVAFDGVANQMTGAVNLSASTGCRIVFGVDDTTSNFLAIYEHGGDVTAAAGRLLFFTNVGGANVGHRVYTTGGSTGLGTASFDDVLTTAQVLSVGHDSTVALGVAFIRKNGVAQSLGSVSTACTSGNLASGTFYLGTRFDGSRPWTGILGGALMMLSGNAQNGDLADAEAYVKNGGGL